MAYHIDYETGECDAPARSAAQSQESSPRVLTGGESPKKTGQGGAFVDWLAFTFPQWRELERPAEFVAHLLRDWTGHPIAVEYGNGLHGFEQSAKFHSVINMEPVLVGVCAWGGSGQRERVYASIDGAGCSIVQDWLLVSSALSTLSARITRLDLALDAPEGQFTVDQAVNWYKEGAFSSGGRRPSSKVAGDWLTPDGSGRTLYVGRRQNGKTARIYEKGKQLGDSSSKWTRFEVEVHNVDRVIPHDAVVRASEYFAGMYACAAPLVDVGAERIKTLRMEQEITLRRLLGFCRLAYGRLVNVARQSMSDDALVDFLTVKGVPRRLAKTALTVSFRTESDVHFLGASYGNLHQESSS